MKTPKTDSRVLELLQAKADSEIAGKTIDCIFEQLVEFAKELEIELYKYTKLYGGMEIGSTITFRHKGEVRVTDIESQIVKYDAIFSDGEFKKMEMPILEFNQRVEFEVNCLGAKIKNK